MQAVLGEQDMRQKPRSGTASRNWMARRRRLSNRLAGAALLPVLSEPERLQPGLHLSESILLPLVRGTFAKDI
jgi:hypothetical protein